MNHGRYTNALGLGLVALASILTACAGGASVESLPLEATSGAVLYVATNGNDSGDGSSASPLLTIKAALARTTEGGTILVRPGTYSGQIRLGRAFTQMVTLRSEVPYKAQLRHSAQVFYTSGGSNVSVEGFDIAHSGPGATAPVIQIDGQGDGSAHDIVIRNNIIHDSYNNDLMKINNGARSITVAGNMLYNQANSDEHMDINSVDGVVVEDNVMFNDFAGAGRSDQTETSSFIVVKDSNENDDGILGARNVTIRRNVLLGWQGSAGHGFVLCGEDGWYYYEAYDVKIENNLMLGNSAAAMRAPFSVKGCRDVTFRNNTISGDLPGAAYALRIVREWENQPAQNIRMLNNVWADQTGTMNDFSDAPASEVASFTLARNLFWNGGKALPFDLADAINPTSDSSALTGDPGLPAPTAITLPRWLVSSGAFADGSTTVKQAFARIVDGYGVAGAAVIDKADSSNAPADDIRGRARSGGADLGAIEVSPVIAAAPVAPAAAAAIAAAPTLGQCTPVGGNDEPTANTKFSAQTGSFQVTATVVPGANGMDGGFGLARGAVSYWANAAAIVMFGTDGVIVARNGGSYQAARTIRYQAGAAYRLRMQVSVSTRSYSVYVTGPDGVEQTLGQNFGFRNSASSLDHWAARAETGALRACDVRVQ